MTQRASLTGRLATSDRPRPALRLGAASLGLLTNRVLRWQLSVLGYAVEIAQPGCDVIGVWGAGPVADRGLALARRWGKPVLWLEDAPLRSLAPNSNETFGISLDHTGLWTAGGASDLSALLEAGDAPHPDAADLRALMRHYRLSKYNQWRDANRMELPRRFILVCDQRRGDAAIAGAGAGKATFSQMLEEVLTRHPGRPILIRGHPRGGGHFDGHPLPDRVQRVSAEINPWDILARAEEVHAVSSQLALEAIFAGHRPVLHGSPLFTGRGLSEDLGRETERANLTCDQLFSVWMMHYPRWLDPVTRRETDLATVLQRLDGAARVARACTPRIGLVDIRLWKRSRLSALFSAGPKRPSFVNSVPAARGHGLRPVVWASSRVQHEGVTRIEDGPLRSTGLGAALTPALSLLVDSEGIAFDASRPSRFESCARDSLTLPARALTRAAALRAELLRLGLTKYNLPGTAAPPEGEGWTVVVGQVANDASLRQGMCALPDASALLRTARAEYPDARLLYRPHPDVVAGLRPGQLASDAEVLADAIDPGCALEELWPRLDRVVTLTSTLGFEALLRGIPVTCYGWPFYAGWGLTDDRGLPGPEARRTATLTLDQLTHTALIDAPIYYDPVRRQPCDPETAMLRLAKAESTAPGLFLKTLSKAQGVLASTPFWR